MCNEKFYDGLFRKMLYATKLRDESYDASSGLYALDGDDASNKVASSDAEGYILSLLLGNWNDSYDLAKEVLGDEVDGILCRTSGWDITLTLYMHRDPDHKTVFHADTLTDLLTGLRDWMDEYSGLGLTRDSMTTPCLVDGLTIFHNDNDRDSVDADVTVLTYDVCYLGWELRIGHDVDDSIETWEQARDAFIECVAMRGEFSTKFIWQDVDIALYAVIGKSLAQVADSIT